MSRRWIRLDVEWDESGWLDGLSGEAAGCWPRLLCWVKLRGKNGHCKMPDLSALARRWRIKRQAVVELVEAGKLDGALEVEGGELVVTKWSEYQEPDRTRAERQARWRERNASNAVTPPLPVTRPPTPDVRHKTKPHYSDEFEEVWKTYPKRAGGNPKARAWKAWRARLRDGVEPAAMLEGVQRYAKFVAATGKVGTEYVMQAATFFGPDERWKAEYIAPAPKVSQRDVERAIGEQEHVRAFVRRHAGLEPVIQERQAKADTHPTKAAGLERPRFDVPGQPHSAA